MAVQKRFFLQLKPKHSAAHIEHRYDCCLPRCLCILVPSLGSSGSILWMPIPWPRAIERRKQCASCPFIIQRPRTQSREVFMTYAVRVWHHGGSSRSRERISSTTAGHRLKESKKPSPSPLALRCQTQYIQAHNLEGIAQRYLDCPEDTFPWKLVRNSGDISVICSFLTL